MADWDPFADPSAAEQPADAEKENVPMATIRSQSELVREVATDKAPEPWEDEAVMAMAGPLGRDLALSTNRMRDIESWVDKAKEAGLDPKEISPAQEKLRMLGQRTPSASWAVVEEKDRKREAAASTLKNAVASCDIKSIKVALVQAYRAEVDSGTLQRARQRLKELEEPVKPMVPPSPKPQLKKEELARELVRAMTSKDISSLRAVLDCASEGGLKLPGLDVARKKLVEMEKAQKATLPPPRPAQNKEAYAGNDCAEDDPIFCEEVIRLRIVLPSSQVEEIEIEAQKKGAAVLAHLLAMRQRGVELSDNPRIFLAEERGCRLFCTEEIKLDQTLQDQGITQTTLLCVRDKSDADLSKDRPNTALQKEIQKSPISDSTHAAKQSCSASKPTAAPLSNGSFVKSQRAPTEAAVQKPHQHWSTVFKVVAEPFPVFSELEQLPGGGRKGPAVVIGWGAAHDQSVKARCLLSMKAVSTSHLMLTGKQNTAQEFDSQIVIPFEPDKHVGAEEVQTLLKVIHDTLCVEPPFLLVVVSRAYVSKRLALVFRKHLPSDVAYLPCPPPNIQEALREELPLFESQIVQEARQLYDMGEDFKSDVLNALYMVSPNWRQKATIKLSEDLIQPASGETKLRTFNTSQEALVLQQDAIKPAAVGEKSATSDHLYAVFKAVVEPFPAFSEVDKLLSSGRQGTSVVVGWGAAQDSVVRARCPQSMKAVGSTHLILTGSDKAPVPQDCSTNFLALQPNGDVDSREVQNLLDGIQKIVGVKPPFLLVVVSRAHVSRRLAYVFRKYLPPEVKYFACPPYDVQAALKEELPEFEGQVVQEAQRLLALGVAMKPDVHGALDILLRDSRHVTASTEFAPDIGTVLSRGPEESQKSKIHTVCSSSESARLQKTREATEEQKLVDHWRAAFKAVVEPFPAFSEVDRLLGGGRKGHAVVLGWGAAEDPSVMARCSPSMKAMGTSHLIITGSREAAPQDSSQSFLAIEPEDHVGSDEVERLLDCIYDAVGVEPPFVLVVVSRGYNSRRLAHAFRKYLPAEIAYFPCPPYDCEAAREEELPKFAKQLMQEARRLHFLGAEFNHEAKEAFDKLSPGWQENRSRNLPKSSSPSCKGESSLNRSDHDSKSPKGTTVVKDNKYEQKQLDNWQLVFKATIEPFPAFNEVDRLLGGGRKGQAVVIGWGATEDAVVKSRCLLSMKAVKTRHVILTGSQGAAPANFDQEHFFAIEPDDHVGSDEVERLLDCIYDSVGVEPPFLLVLVSHAYVSRRLAFAFRKHLPEDVAYFPCPPHDGARAFQEELPRFQAQVLQEARRLHFMGAIVKDEAREALNMLQPDWKERAQKIPREGFTDTTQLCRDKPQEDITEVDLDDELPSLAC